MSALADKLETVKPTETQLRARRSRNVAIAVALALFVVVVYATSIVVGFAVFDRTF
jgi:hypothetical protein